MSAPKFPTYETQVTKIKEAYNRAIEAGFASDTDWYHEARELATFLAAKYGYTVAQVAGVISALSPTKHWDENVRLADLALRTGESRGTYGPACRKAEDIMAMPCPMGVLDILGQGDKTRNFYMNILVPDGGILATVDTHAMKVAGYNSDRISAKRYPIMQAAYQAVAAELGIKPLELQAVTWVWYRTLTTEERQAHMAW